MHLVPGDIGSLKLGERLQIFGVLLSTEITSIQSAQLSNRLLL